DAYKIGISHPELVYCSSDVSRNLELLLARAVRASVILDNPKLLTHRHEKLCLLLNILNDMKPKNISDFAPLAVEPHVVAKYVSNKLFVLDGNFESFNEKLQMMLKYIAPIDILHDLWAFQYSPALMESRLSRAKEGHLKIIKPWVIRCPEKTFIKSLQIASSEKAALGEKSMIAFLSERLNIDEEMVEAIMKKHPELITIGGARVKEVLDYLIDEAGFTEDQIVQSPLILCRLSLRTIKQRINELKLLDYRPNTFNTICRSFSGYKKFVEKLKKRKKF
ncbi:Transcription termination factor, mitochondrial, partial [Pseudolycoriella hygida]